MFSLLESLFLLRLAVVLGEVFRAVGGVSMFSRALRYVRDRTWATRAAELLGQRDRRELRPWATYDTFQALNTAQGARAALENGQPGESGDGRFPCGQAVTPRCNAKTFSQPELRPDVDSQCSIRGTLHRSTARSNSIKQERNGEQ